MKKIIYLIQLGSPKDPSVPSVRTYLKEFLGDPRLIDLPRILWLPILYLFVLPFRPKKSAEGYQRLWEGDGFPLVKRTNLFAHNLKTFLPSEWDVRPAFVLSTPRFKDELACLKQDLLNKSTAEVWFLPQYPQYSEATTASIVDLWAHATKTWVNMPTFHFIPQYFSSKCFIDGSVNQINHFLDSNPNIEQVVMSFHGLPKKRITEKKDDYYWQCLATFDLIKSALKFPADKIHIAFQSQFGRDEWLTPSTINFTQFLLEKGNRNIAVYCPSFVVDCLETSVEIGEELEEEAHEHFPDAHIHLIPCLNNEPSWVQSYALFVQTQVAGNWREKQNLSYAVDEDQYKNKSKESINNDVTTSFYQKKKMNANTATPFTPEVKKSLWSIFLIVFIDLLGFSIIFPLIPAISSHYLAADPSNYFLNLLWNWVYAIGSLVGAPLSQTQGMVLFGCMLGAIYSFLQFFATVFWGNWSDKIGRKKILLCSTIGMSLSYALWFFSGSFTLLIVSRLLAGLMSGNISVASAAVADVTTEDQRSKGMASIGIAFAFGFVFGPAIGGLSMLIDLPQMFPSLIDYGVNPFSSAALIAFTLSVINIFLLIRFFNETWKPELVKDLASRPQRTFNILKIFKPLPILNVNIVNFTYFLFISIFSGMEFTLTFLTVERLNYLPMHNGFMFVFIGLMIALVQGGFVRRKAHIIGEAKVTLIGLFTIIPGLILISFAHSTFLLLLGLFFLSAGSAMAIPCLTSLVSLFSPRELQGKSLGIFRSLGAVGRIVGPLAGSIIFWRFGSSAAYIAGAIALIAPVIILRRLQKTGD